MGCTVTDENGFRGEVDLTKIDKPLGLLDDETQEALKAHGGPYEFYGCNKEWVMISSPIWSCACVYRVNPGPKTSEESRVKVRSLRKSKHDGVIAELISAAKKVFKFLVDKC